MIYILLVIYYFISVVCEAFVWFGEEGKLTLGDLIFFSILSPFTFILVVFNYVIFTNRFADKIFNYLDRVVLFEKK